jgi:glycosyltransferase involved in cell wall biosynthesis
MKEKRVIVVMPAYNAARTLEQTLAEIPPGVVDEARLVDDALLRRGWR